MPQVVLSWLFFSALCLLIGARIDKKIIAEYFPSSKTSSLWLQFWMGMAGLYVLLSLTTFFFPLNDIVKPFVWLGSAILAWPAKTLIQTLYFHIRQRIKELGPASWLIFLLTAGIALLKSAGSPEIFDEGAYHLPMIRMWEEKGIVPGFANLNAHYGLHSGWHLLSAFSSMSFLPGFVYDSGLNGLIAVMIGLFSASRLQRMLKKKALIISSVIALCLPIFLFRNLLSSPATDVPAIAGCWFFFILWLESMENKIPAASSPALFLILPVFLVILKASTAGLLLAPAGYIVYHSFLHRKTRFAAATLLVCGLPASLWLLQNWLLSGYLFYPMEFSAFGNPDWLVPPESMQKKFYPEQFGAFAPPASYNLHWLKSWFAAHNSDSKVIIILATAFLALFPVLKLFRIRSFNPFHYGFYLLLLIPASIWFLTVTEPRYGFGVLVIAALFLPAVCLVEIQKKIPAILYAPSLILLLLVLNFRKSFQEYELQGNHILRPASVPLVKYRSLNCGNFKASCPTAYLSQVPSGKPVFCWDCPFPCFPLEGIQDSAFVFENKMAWFTTFSYHK